MPNAMPVTAVTPRGTDNPTIKGIFAEKIIIES